MAEKKLPESLQACPQERCLVLDGYQNFSVELLKAQSIGELIQKASAFITTIARPVEWGLFVLDAPKQNLNVVAGYGPRLPGWSKAPLPIHSGGVAEWVLKNRVSAIVSPIDGASLNQFHHPKKGLPQPRSLTVFPLCSGAHFIGVLVLIDAVPPSPRLSMVAFQTLETLASVVGVVMCLLSTQRELEVLAFSDPLTELANRRTFQRRLDQEVQRTKRHGTRFFLILLDLDKFKLVNDSYGHPIGDLILKTFARILAEIIRKTDIAARLGGDEFAILGMGSTIKECEDLVKRLKAEVDNCPVDLGDGNRLAISFSAGFSVVDPKRPETIYQETDNSLYNDKKSNLPYRSIDFHRLWAEESLIQSR